jgi:hypothetical protein
MARIAFSIIFANRTVCHLRHKRKSTGNSIPPIAMTVEVTPRLRAMAPKRTGLVNSSPPGTEGP